ncbi:MAG: dynein regulation protein LC7 [Chloroflexi bacterium]|nr:dynein regulation protein LC7 [Chloroflexota bacterium]
MANTQEILNNLTKIEGIVAALLVGRDGFVIESSGDSKIDTEAVGALVITARGAYEVMGKELDIGKATQIMAEFERSAVMAAAIGSDAVLAIVTGANANLGNIRYQVKRYSRELETST